MLKTTRVYFGVLHILLNFYFFSMSNWFSLIILQLYSPFSFFVAFGLVESIFDIFQNEINIFIQIFVSQLVFL